MSTKVMEMQEVFAQDDMAAQITWQWDKFYQQRRVKDEEWKELRNYIFATDTTKTTNASLPWNNTTTIPKLTQIRDNLHSNYISGLFPTDQWLKWEGHNLDDETQGKAEAIEAYMANKCRGNEFRTIMSKLLYDYIDYGNAFMTVTFENNYKTKEDGTVIPGYVGPKLQRISPLDIVFNPFADTFQDTFKVVRSVKTVGELKKMAEAEPDNYQFAQAMQDRDLVLQKLGGYSIEDFDKWEGYNIDGFGNLYEYYTSGYVEILEFYGDIHDEKSGTMQTDKIITIIDRARVIRNVDNPSWFASAPIFHVGWRFRPDNLWAMGPLDNLVGMQYRLDHLENLKADAMDMAIRPPLKIIGEVEEFQWGPGAEIQLDEGGDVQELAQNAQWVITAQSELAQLEDRMELYAGAPREAMGMRTPGEKTAFEVQSLQNAAGRIFQEKLTNFELNGLEPALNAMLETARRNMNGSDVIRVMNDDLGIHMFRTITKEDITASGQLRPIGARHFAQQAQMASNLQMISGTPIWQQLQPDISRAALGRMVEDLLNLQRYDLFQSNVGVYEQQETQRQMNQASEDLAVEATVPASGGGNEEVAP